MAGTAFFGRVFAAFFLSTSCLTESFFVVAGLGEGSRFGLDFLVVSGGAA